MKKHFITIVLILFTISSFAQDRQKMNDVYKAASKENRIIGWVFLSGGAGLIVAGILKGGQDFGVGKTLLTVGGIGLCIASIPLF